jgi:hypothetical protein
MNEEKYSSVEPAADGDMDTTPPNPAVSAPPAQEGKWEMPRPVFRKTSGRLPQSFVPPAAPSAADPTLSRVNTDVSAAAAAGEVDPAMPPADEAIVEPQPQISEEITLESDETHVPEVKKERSPVVKAILIIGVLLVIAGFVALFLSVVYFLFLTPTAEPTF